MLPLKPLHPDSSLSSAKLNQISRVPTEILLHSLKPGQKDCLKTSRRNYPGRTSPHQGPQIPRSRCGRSSAGDNRERIGWNRAEFKVQNLK